MDEWTWETPVWWPLLYCFAGLVSRIAAAAASPIAAVIGNTETRVNCVRGERSEYISTLAQEEITADN